MMIGMKHTRTQIADVDVPPTNGKTDVTSPSMRRTAVSGNGNTNVDSISWDNTTNTAQEQNLFSPRSTAAMALSSISQVFTSVNQKESNITSTKQAVRNATSNEKELSTTMTKHQDHTQLPPPQSLFTSNDTMTTSLQNDNNHDDESIPLIPCVPTVHRERVDGPSSHATYHTDTSKQMNIPPHSNYTIKHPYENHYPQQQQHQQHHSFPTPSPPDHPSMMHHESGGRYQQHAVNGHFEEPIPYALHQSYLQNIGNNNHAVPSGAVGTHPTTIPQHQHNPQYHRYDTQNHTAQFNHQNPTTYATSGHNYPHLPSHHHYPPQESSYLNGVPASWTPAGTKSETHPASGRGNWATPFHLQIPNRPSDDIINATPNNNNINSNVYIANPPVIHASNTTPHHPINRCGSYGSAGSHSSYHSSRVANHHQPTLPPPSQMIQPPHSQQAPVPTAQYHRTVSFSNNDAQQWIPNGVPPPQFTPMMPRQQPYYPAPSQVLHGGGCVVNHPMYHYVTPTPHKKQKIGGMNVTPSNHTLFHPPKASIMKKNKPMSTTRMSSSKPPPTFIASADSSSQFPLSDDGLDLDTSVNGTQTNDNENRYNRKNKSLGVLAESFVAHFTDQSKQDNDGNDIFQEVMIDQLSSELAVERRRIYDVVNILESLQVVIKRGKNTYHWMGREHLTRQFALLQNEAIESWPEQASKSNLISTQQRSNVKNMDHSINSTYSDSIETVDGYFTKDGKVVALMDHTDYPNKSLTRLSQLFLEVFLIIPEPLSLPQASDLIHGGRSSNAELIALGMKPGDEYPTDKKKLQQIVARGLKTKIRRLYDIANVFMSVGLLQKTENRSAPTTEGKRPVYSLNYHLSIHDIRSVYFTLPPHMIKSKSPFSDLQISKLEKKYSVQLHRKYFGLSAPILSHSKAIPTSFSEPALYTRENDNNVGVVSTSSDENGEQSSEAEIATTPPSTSQSIIPSSIVSSPRRVSH